METTIAFFLYNMRLGIVPFVLSYCFNNFHGLVRLMAYIHLSMGEFSIASTSM